MMAFRHRLTYDAKRKMSLLSSGEVFKKPPTKTQILCQNFSVSCKHLVGFNQNLS